MGRLPHFLQPLLTTGPNELALYVVGQPAPLATHVEPAFDSAARKRGLLGRHSMAITEALIIAPCNAVHTFRMHFDIDIIYAARDGSVLKVRERLRPGRISGAWNAFATIEMSAGTIARVGLRPGSRLQIR